MARSPYLFGVRRGTLPRATQAQIRKIADDEDCNFYSAQGHTWFATRREQLGEPFDRNLARSVLAAVKVRGIEY